VATANTVTEHEALPPLGALLPAVGIAAVSRNTADAAIALAHELRRHILIVASRNQVDLQELGGGYVGGWTAESFANYVRSRDASGLVLLCRDHGGPWQNSHEVGSPPNVAIASALRSFFADIESGFSILHIDTSLLPVGEADVTGQAIETMLQLYEDCVAFCARRGKRVAFEVGIESQSGDVSSLESWLPMLQTIVTTIADRGLPRPLFVVAQTGTLVKNGQNVGAICSQRRQNDVTRQLQTMVQASHSFGVRLKAHNCDFLDKQHWEILAKNGITAANVGPEYGVTETRTLVDIMTSAGQVKARDSFLEAAYDSGRWRRWVGDSSLSDLDKAILAGHYVFDQPLVVELKQQVGRTLGCGLEGVDRLLQTKLVGLMRRHLGYFGAITQYSRRSRI